jgi:hypothetical protein
MNRSVKAGAVQEIKTLPHCHRSNKLRIQNGGRDEMMIQVKSVFPNGALASFPNAGSGHKPKKNIFLLLFPFHFKVQKGISQRLIKRFQYFGSHIQKGKELEEKKIFISLPYGPVALEKVTAIEPFPISRKVRAILEK